MIAALYVATGGSYFGLPDVDPWDEPRDARTYAGPHSVVAHPPCRLWVNFAALNKPTLNKAEALATPPAFRDALLMLARHAGGA